MPKVHIRWRDLLFLLIGAVLSTILNNWSYFKFNSEISISDLLTAGVGAYVGLYIGGKLTAEVSSQRIEKDLLIKDLPEVKSQLTKLFSQLESGNVVFSDTLATMKKSSQTLNELKDMVAICKPSISGDLDLSNLLQLLRILNLNLTSYPRTPVGLFAIPITNYHDLKDQTKNINDEITIIIFKINRS
jgi:hypothetical protein